MLAIGYENNIIKRLEVMERLNFSMEEIREYRRQHWSFSAVRSLEIQEKLEQGNLDEAAQILRESKNFGQRVSRFGCPI